MWREFFPFFLKAFIYFMAQSDFINALINFYVHLKLKLSACVWASKPKNPLNINLFDVEFFPMFGGLKWKEEMKLNFETNLSVSESRLLMQAKANSESKRENSKWNSISDNVHKLKAR